MKKIVYLSLLLCIQQLNAQNFGIGVKIPSKAKFEVHGIGGLKNNSTAVFGSDAAGISFQSGKPGIGFNQYPDSVTGKTKFMSFGFGASQHFDPAYCFMITEMMAGGQFEQQPSTIKRAFTIDFQHVVIGEVFSQAMLTVKRGGHNATAYLHGSQHHSAFNFGNEEHTYIRAGKDGGAVIINDIPGGDVNLFGYVGINTATPVYPLEIRQSNARGIALVEPENFANWDFSIQPSTGRLLLSANGINLGWFSASDASYHLVSDSRLKTNIRDLSPVLKKFMLLNPVNYKMIDGSDQQHTGFLAQDLRKLFPEVVTVSADSSISSGGIKDLHMVNYESISMLNIKAMQEQQDLIAKQQRMIAALKAKISDLKKLAEE